MGHKKYILSEVVRPHGPWVKYHYAGNTGKLIRKERPGGCYMRIQYNGKNVSRLIGPVGTDSAPVYFINLKKEKKIPIRILSTWKTLSDAAQLIK